ncbi:MAG: flavin reductase family protein [Promethearchaeota archaeon]
MESNKVFLEPSNKLFPIPAVLVTSCSKDKKKNNIISIAWVGTISTDPPMLSISVRKSRFSYPLIKETMEFVVNIPTEYQAWEVDWCGLNSGKSHDKFIECGLTPIPANKVRPPLILECPVNIECKVIRIIEDISESHHIFIGEVVSVDVDKEFVDLVDPSKMKPLAYCNGNYFGISKMVGKYGFSKKKAK